MNVVESFYINVPAFQTQNVEINPSYQHDIIGFFLNNHNAPLFIKVSIITANSETIVNSVPANVISLTNYQEWSKRYIPTNIPSQRLFLRVENDISGVNFVDNFILVYNAENPASCR